MATSTDQLDAHSGVSETENLVTVMTCNEVFDVKKPDTFFEVV